MIANAYDFKVLFKVATNIIPFFFNSFALSLIKISEKHGLFLKKLDGMKFNILDDNWKVSNDTSVNYIVKLKKN